MKPEKNSSVQPQSQDPPVNMLQASKESKGLSTIPEMPGDRNTDSQSSKTQEIKSSQDTRNNESSQPSSQKNNSKGIEKHTESMASKSDLEESKDVQKQYPPGQLLDNLSQNDFLIKTPDPPPYRKQSLAGNLPVKKSMEKHLPDSTTEKGDESAEVEGTEVVHHNLNQGINKPDNMKSNLQDYNCTPRALIQTEKNKG